MTDKASYALLHGFGNVAIALAIGYVFYKLIRTKDTPTKVSDYGRNWLAWMVLIATMAGLPNVIMKPSPDAIFKFIAPLVVFSLIAFVFGLIYGKFKLPKKALNNSSVEVEKQLNTPLDNQTSGSGINCSSCGVEITPKGAKFCGRCGAKFEPPKISNVNTDSGTKTKAVSQNISSSSTSKAETVRPPTIEKKIVDEIQPEKIPSENQEKKTEKTAVYINEKPINNRPGNGPGPGVQKNTKNNLILLFIFTALFFLVFSGDKNTKDTSAADKNTLIDSTKDKSITYGTVAYDNEDVYSLKKEIQAEEDQEREFAQEDILNELKANYINQIASRVKEQWRYQGAKDNWGCDVYILQDLNGKVQSVNLQSCNVTNGAKVKVFKDAIERAVYKASPLPPAPDKSVYDREILFHFRVKESERRSNAQVDFTQLRNHLKYNNGKTTEYYKENGYTWMEADHYKEWKHYTGWSKNGMPSGYGRIIIRGDLDTYEGELLKGHMHGYGIYTHSSDGMYYKGRFKFGNYDEGSYYDRYGELIQQVQ